jgi:peptidoglycan/LPS O-acetylase OafA/YrhL
MVNTGVGRRSALGLVSLVVWCYIALVAATVTALVVLSQAAPALATQQAWGHAVIVAVFALVLPLRLRPAQRGSVRAHRAVGIIAAVLLVVNLAEAGLPGVFPVWMRVQMLATAALMLLILGCLAAAKRRNAPRVAPRV